MEVDILVEGEGLADVEPVHLPVGAEVRELVVAVALRSGFPCEEALLFVEDGDEPLNFTGLTIDERMSERVHHVHRARQIEVSVFYMAGDKSKAFPPAARVQKILDWAVGPEGFRIDPLIAPEMELALHGQTTPLPKSAHIGRFVRHPEHTLALDLIRGVVPNGG